MSLYIVDIHGEIEGDYEIVRKYEEQESLKPMIEIDLDYVIKQKYIEREVLDKIRAEIEEYKSRQLTLAIGVADLEEGKQIALEYVLAIIDKYKAETEEV